MKLKSLALPSQILLVLSASGVFLLMVHVIAEVISRGLFGTPLRGTLEYVTYWWMVIIVFGALGYAQKENEHIDVPLLYDGTAGVFKKIFSLISLVLTLVVGLGIIYFSLDYAIANFAAGEYSGATGVLLWPMKFLVPLGTLVYLIEVVRSYFSSPEDKDFKSTNVKDFEINDNVTY